jgi:predicted glycoside hydrolase/deacetylase ChbG (UPF0249 family)
MATRGRAFVVASSSLLCLLATAAAAQEIKLVLRGDDLGSTQGSLVAIEEALNHGVLTSTSIMVPAPWFEGAAQLSARNPGWCTGVHLTLVGEWRGYRWRPVLPWDKVRSLVDEDGFLYRYPGELFAHNPRLEEIDAELRAQVALARKKGVRVQYLDTHYLPSSAYAGLTEVIDKMARDYDLPTQSRLGLKQVVTTSFVAPEQKKEKVLATLAALAPGTWLWIFHPGIDSPEQNALVHFAPDDIFVEGVGRQRAAETSVLTSQEMRSLVWKRGIVLTSYSELWREMKGEK